MVNVSSLIEYDLSELFLEVKIWVSERELHQSELKTFPKTE
jgi:hypothetical protein